VSQDFTATIIWDDDSLPVPATVTETEDGTFHVFPEEPKDYSSPGDYQIVVIISDIDGRNAIVSTTASAKRASGTVSGGAGTDLTATDGDLSGATLATFSTSARHVEAVIDWGDGDVDTDTFPGDGDVTVTGSHSYGDDQGKYRITVTPIPYYAHPGDLVDIPTPIVSTVDCPSSDDTLTPKIIVENALTTFSAEVAEWDGSPSDIKCLVIQWGDGTESAGDISAGSIVGAHQYLGTSALSRLLTVNLTTMDGTTHICHSTAYIAAPSPSNFSLTTNDDMVIPTQDTSATILATLDLGGAGISEYPTLTAEVIFDDGASTTLELVGDGSELWVVGGGYYEFTGNYQETIAIRLGDATILQQEVSLHATDYVAGSPNNDMIATFQDLPGPVRVHCSGHQFDRDSRG
jgi:hypothetical protein